MYISTEYTAQQTPYITCISFSFYLHGFSRNSSLFSLLDEANMLSCEQLFFPLLHAVQEFPVITTSASKYRT